MLGLSVETGLRSESGRSRQKSPKPLNTRRPDVVGQGAVGAVLALDPGLWSGDPAPQLTVQWRRNGQLLSGQSGMTYTVQPSDEGAVLFACVAAQNAGGVSEACSPLLPVWPNTAVQPWGIERPSTLDVRILRSPGTPPVGLVTATDAIEIE